MRRTMAGLLGLVLLAVLPDAAQAGSAELRLGGFSPTADSNLFDDASELYGTTDKDWRGFTGGLEFNIDVAPHLEIGFHVDGYGRQLATSYVDFERNNGSEIRQELRLSTVPVGATLRFSPTGRRAALSPYVAAGVDVVGYRYEEFGDFIDFFSPGLDIEEDAFVSDGAAFGYHFAAGLRVPVGSDLSITGEVRYLRAKADMGDDFRENEIDLGGTSVTLGLHLRF